MRKRSILIIILLAVLLMSAVSGCNKTVIQDNDELTVDYKINVSMDENNDKLYLSQSTNVCNTTATAIDKLYFYLYANAYEDSGGKFIVGCVKQNEVEADYQIDGINLIINLSSPIKPNESSVIQISGTTLIPSGNLRFGKTKDGVYNLHGFFPRLAYFENDAFRVMPYSTVGDPYYFGNDNFDLTLQYPDKYIVAHSGLTQSVTENENIITEKILINGARDIAITLNKDTDVNVYKTEVNDVKISHLTKAEDKTAFISRCVAFFMDLFGEFPYESLVVAESDFKYGGMEYSGLVLVNENSREKEYVIVHEIIHQWIGLSVGSNSFEECWVDESLTNFLTYYYIDKINGVSVSETVEQEKLYYKNYVEFIGKEQGIVYSPRLNVNLNEFTSMDEYSLMVYDYGVIMYGNVYDVVGDEKFIKGVKDYYQTYKGKIATGERLVSCFKSSCGKKVEAIFKGYLDCKVIF